MDILNGALTVIYVFACLFLGFVVLIQKGEGGGLGGAFGGGAVDVAFGAKADMTWKRATAVSAALFMGLAIVIGILTEQIQQKSIAIKAAQDQKTEQKADEEKPDGAGTEEDAVRILSFWESTGRTYSVENTTNLLDHSWTPVATGITGLGGLKNLRRTNTLNRIYYRIGVEYP